MFSGMLNPAVEGCHETKAMTEEQIPVALRAGHVRPCLVCDPELTPKRSEVSERGTVPSNVTLFIPTLDERQQPQFPKGA